MKTKLQERIETPRLILRKPILKDAEQLFKKFAQSTEVTKYLTWTPHEDINETFEFMKLCIEQWETINRFAYSICLKGTEELIGMIDPRIDEYKAGIGYALAKEYWKQGYMPEALKAVIQELQHNEKIYRIWAVCDVDNYGSRRVMEKAGMECEGKLKRWIIHPNISKEPRDCLVYSIVK